MPRKILHELRIRRAKDGGHIVEHHHDAAHDPESHKFRRSGAAVQHLLSHVDKLEPKGTMRPEVEEQEGSEPNPWAGRPRPFSFDRDAAEGVSISGRRK